VQLKSERQKERERRERERERERELLNWFIAFTFE
jgi:hypothetical protein